MVGRHHRVEVIADLTTGASDLLDGGRADAADRPGRTPDIAALDAALVKPRLPTSRRVARTRRTGEAAARTRTRPTGAGPFPGWLYDAWLIIVGLAPAAHGANRTGRMFIGDRSGDVLFAALHAVGVASRPTAIAADDGLKVRPTTRRCTVPRRTTSPPSPSATRAARGSTANSPCSPRRPARS